ncbi:hypothetical protein ACFL54_07880 [Planctomycetota bacterium]
MKYLTTLLFAFIMIAFGFGGLAEAKQETKKAKKTLERKRLVFQKTQMKPKVIIDKRRKSNNKKDIRVQNNKLRTSSQATKNAKKNLVRKRPVSQKTQTKPKVIIYKRSKSNNKKNIRVQNNHLRNSSQAHKRIYRYRSVNKYKDHSQCFRMEKVWIPGHYIYKTQDILIPGYFKEVWVQPKFKVFKKGCFRLRIKIRDGFYKRVWVSERYETRTVKVWVTGYWAYK